MEGFMEFFKLNNWAEFSIRNLIFGLIIIFTIWLIAFILARKRLFIKQDEEIKVWFGWLFALIFSLLIITGYIILIAFQNWSNIYDQMIPILILILLGALALSVSNKIRDKLSLLKSKRS